MTTRNDMLTEIQSDTERTSAADVVAMQSKINAAIRHYQPTRFWFNESRSVIFPTVAGTDIYTTATIGTVFYQIDGVWVTVTAGDVREVDREDYNRLEALADSDSTQGVPDRYSYVEAGMRFYKKPDAVYSIRAAGHVKLAGPVDDVTDNDWMTHAYDLIMCRAKAELYAHRWEDQQNAALMTVGETSALAVLLGATSDKTAQGYMTATQF